MMQMECMTLGLFQTNCYLVWDEASAQGIVIDPGYSAARIGRRLDALGITPLAIVLTHGHFDHVGAVAPLAERYACPVWLGEPDAALPPELTNGPIPYTDLFRDGQTLRFGPLTLEAGITPGHTPGSACLRLGSWLFTGDTLFRDTCGRTDLWGGSWEQMQRSLAHLAALEDDLEVFPGHGEPTTLSRERRTNPYLREVRR